MAVLDPDQTLAPEALQQRQLERLRAMLGPVLADNAFYRVKLNQAGVNEPGDVDSIKAYRRLPFTTKDELSRDQSQHPPYGSLLTYSPDQYTRLHQTSGTTGQRLRWLDTEASWDWWGRCWAAVYRAAGISAADRLFFAFSFGPFIGFWSACEGARQLGALIIPGGGMSSLQRVEAILANQATVLVCTPTYALHLAQVAQAAGLDLAGSTVHTTVHAGEPGASLPATKARLEQAWGARCFDHAGATEVGAWGFECQAQDGVHLNESEFICEVVDPATDEPAQAGELVITNLGRTGMPVIRYRTGDRVELYVDNCACGCTYRRLQGGVTGRLDDALIVRGVNCYPSAVENIVHRFPQVVEFAVDVHRRNALDEVELRLELQGADGAGVAAQIGHALHQSLGLRVAVEVVSEGSLPRFDLKARRFTDHRKAD
ncbi:MAG: phenylacetate--CoA ligase family protein [Candidatus Latescibacteria bacterium]|nr:phenylacetate--CoA ligase family protein [Candidatus Latescibacterota bacterium]